MALDRPAAIRALQAASNARVAADRASAASAGIFAAFAAFAEPDAVADNLIVVALAAAMSADTAAVFANSVAAVAAKAAASAAVNVAANDNADAAAARADTAAAAANTTTNAAYAAAALVVDDIVVDNNIILVRGAAAVCADAAIARATAIIAANDNHAAIAADDNNDTDAQTKNVVMPLPGLGKVVATGTYAVAGIVNSMQQDALVLGSVIDNHLAIFTPVYGFLSILEAISDLMTPGKANKVKGTVKFIAGAVPVWSGVHVGFGSTLLSINPLLSLAINSFSDLLFAGADLVEHWNDPNLNKTKQISDFLTKGLASAGWWLLALAPVPVNVFVGMAVLGISAGVSLYNNLSASSFFSKCSPSIKRSESTHNLSRREVRN